MSGWPYDVHADEDDELTKLRIPVTSSHPGFAFLVSFDRMSEMRPTCCEAEILSLFIEYRRNSHGARRIEEMLKRPLDTAPMANTVTLHKWATDDWGYRRSTFNDAGPLFWPGRPGGVDRQRSYTLVELLDQIESTCGTPFPEWVRFKGEHVSLNDEANEVSK